MKKTVLLLILLAILTTITAKPMPWKAKGELLKTGYISDTLGYLYNVRIVPGYQSPLNMVKSQWGKGWGNQVGGASRLGHGLVGIPSSLKYMKGYFTPKPWEGIADGLSDSWYAEGFIIKRFVGAGIANTWVDYMGNAETLRKNGTIGWWLAYPWYITKGTVNTALRLATGAVAVPTVALYGLALRPTWELSYPVLQSSGSALYSGGHGVWGVGEMTWGTVANQVIGGVVAPVSLDLWNTGVGVPIALVSRMPTPQNAKSFWVAIDPASPALSVENVVDSAIYRDYLQFVTQKKEVEAEMNSFDSLAAPQERKLNQEIAVYQGLIDSLEQKKQELWSVRQHKNYSLEQRTTINAPKNSLSRWSDEYKMVEKALKAYSMDSNNEDNKVYRSLFIKKYGGNYLKKSVDRRKEKYNPNSIVGDEVDAIFK